MKNRYLRKYLCISLAAAMIAGAPGNMMLQFTSAEEELSSGQAPAEPESVPVVIPDAPAPEIQPTPEPEQTTVPEPEADPSPAPENIEPTAAPEPTEAPSETPVPTETPTPSPEPTPVPEEPSPTPTPQYFADDPGLLPEITLTPAPSVSPTPTPTGAPASSERVQAVINAIQSLAGVEITADLRSRIEQIRIDYNVLTEEEKAQVTNYGALVEMEQKLLALVSGDQLSDGAAALVGVPVYYTNMVSNLHAGKEFYLNSLQNNYQLSFSEDFSDIMDQIEEEYLKEHLPVKENDEKEEEKLSSETKEKLTTSRDKLLVRNWQDILAIYAYHHLSSGEKELKLNKDAKPELAAIFAEMNPLIQDKTNPDKVEYDTRHVNYFIKEYNVDEAGREIIRKYMETDCKLLCAVVTAANGFIRESVGDNVSEERVNVISAAYSLIGKVGYFWGGKSLAIGEDSTWGQAAKVEAPGSVSTGTIRAYGLDCSGFVTWAVINGYRDTNMEMAVGEGTSDQWDKCRVVQEADAQPGDLVFQRGPEAGSDNHVGILCGKTDAGDWIAVHCSSSKNGVTVGEAYGASFRYIRQPSFFLTAEELAQIEKENEIKEEDTLVVSESSITDILGEDWLLTSGSEEIAAEGTETVTDEKDASDGADVSAETGEDLSEAVIPDSPVSDTSAVVSFDADMDIPVNESSEAEEKVLVDDSEVVFFDLPGTDADVSIDSGENEAVSENTAESDVSADGAEENAAASDAETETEASKEGEKRKFGRQGTAKSGEELLLSDGEEGVSGNAGRGSGQYNELLLDDSYVAAFGDPVVIDSGEEERETAEEKKTKSEKKKTGTSRAQRRLLLDDSSVRFF